MRAADFLRYSLELLDRALLRLARRFVDRHVGLRVPLRVTLQLFRRLLNLLDLARELGEFNRAVRTFMFSMGQATS